jgi:hypothetical protein
MENIPVSGVISPIYPADKYPVIDPVFGIDGLRNLSTLNDMFNIPLEKRRAGMVVGIADGNNNTVAYYKLKPEGNGLTWSVGTSSDWDGFLNSPTASIPIKYRVINETIDVPTNYLYLVYGDLTIGATGVFNNYGKTVIINGTLVTQSAYGTGSYNEFSGSFFTVSFFTQKVVKTFSAVQDVGYTVSHNLNTPDFTYSLRNSFNYIQANVELSSTNPNNDVIVTCATSVPVVTMTIIG